MGPLVVRERLRPGPGWRLSRSARPFVGSVALCPAWQIAGAVRALAWTVTGMGSTSDPRPVNRRLGRHRSAQMGYIT